MNATYLILNLVFSISILIFIAARTKVTKKAWWRALAIVTLLTLLFDPVIIALDIVDYDPTKILGLRWFGAPIEDLFYALYAACIVPLIWHKLESRHDT